MDQTHRPTSSPPSPLQLALWLNLLMAASAAGWVVVTSRLLGLPMDGLLVLLAFALAVAFYTRDRLDEREQTTDAATMPLRTAWVQRHTAGLRRLVWLGLSVGAAVLLLRPWALPPILAGLGFALSYTVRWFPWRGRRVGWKHLPGMKAPYVALLWSLLTVLTPATVYGVVSQGQSWLLAAAVALLIMDQILVNDLRDIEGDRAHGTLSLPVLLDERAARCAGYALAALAALITFPLSPLALPLSALYSALLLWRYRRANDGWWRPWIEVQGAVAALLVIALP